MLALGVCIPQTCTHVCRVKLTNTVLPTDHFVSTTKRCKLDSTENLCWFEKYPTPPEAIKHNDQFRNTKYDSRKLLTSTAPKSTESNSAFTIL